MLEINDFNSAELYFTIALKEARDVGNLRWIAACLHALAYAVGRQRKNRRKIKLCREQIEIQKNLANDQGVRLAAYDLYFAHFWLARDMERLGKFSGALHHFQAAFEAAKSARNPELAKRAERNNLDLKAFLRAYPAAKTERNPRRSGRKGGRKRAEQ